MDCIFGVIEMKENKQTNKSLHLAAKDLVLL